MTSPDLISIIVRFYNEAKFLPAVFEAVQKQITEIPVEIVSVNNNSSDESRKIAALYSDILIDVKHYEPGKALNEAIEISNGTIIVVLSAHTIPGDKFWLKKLVAPFFAYSSSKKLIATYGAQIYPYYSDFLDKRDLDIFNFASSRFERNDTDFWNANSAFERNTWEENKFCEFVYELEDHLWTKKILAKEEGCVFFNPDAYVYHYGHNARIDRKYPNIPPNSESEYLDKAKSLLNSTDDWSDIMWASLVCNTVPNTMICNEIIDSLGKHLINHYDFDVRWRVAQTLGNIPNDCSILYLTNALSDSSFYPRNEAAWSLRKLLPHSLNLVSDIFYTSTGEEKLFSAFILGASKSNSAQKKAINYLLSLLSNAIKKDIITSLYIIGEIASNDYILDTIPIICDIIKAQEVNEKTISIAIWCLGRIYEEQDYNFPLSQIMNASRKHQNFLIRYESINALSRYLQKSPNTEVIRKISNYLNFENDNRVKYAIYQAIRRLPENCICNVAVPGNKILGDKDFGAEFECALINKGVQII